MKQSWMQANWRPYTSWAYTTICVYDFMIMPSFVFWWAHFSNTPYIAWSPVTLQGGALFHIAMGAIVTATSWQKSKEKIAAGIISKDNSTNEQS